MATVGVIYVYGEIIPESWNWFGDATSLISVQRQIASLGSYDELEYHVFSPGGYCTEGWGIAEYLLTLGKKLTSVAYGQCASIATIIQSVASTRKITPNCDFMIHLPWGGVEGNEHEVRSYLIDLVTEGDKIAKQYAKVTGGNQVVIKEQLVTDFHMTGQQAVDAGYATELLGSEPQAMKNYVKPKSRPALALLRRPKNIALKSDPSSLGTGPAWTGAPIELKPGVVTQQPNMVQPTQNTNALAALFASFSKSILNVLSGTPAKALDVNTESGQTIVIDVTGDTPAIGDKVTMKDTGETAPNGDYTASGEEKTVYTVTDGAISNIDKPEGDTSDAADKVEEVTPVAASTTDADKDAEIANLKQQLADLQTAQANAATETQKRLDLMAAALGQKQSKDVTVSADKDPIVDAGDKPLSATERKAKREADAKAKADEQAKNKK